METYLIKEARGAERALIGHIDTCKKAVMREEIKAKLDVEKTVLYKRKKEHARDTPLPLTTPNSCARALINSFIK